MFPRLLLVHALTPETELWLWAAVLANWLLAGYGVYCLVSRFCAYLCERKRQQALIDATVARVLAFKAQEAGDPDAERTHVPPGIYGWQRDNGRRH